MYGSVFSWFSREWQRPVTASPIAGRYHRNWPENWPETGPQRPVPGASRPIPQPRTEPDAPAAMPWASEACYCAVERASSLPCENCRRDRPAEAVDRG